MCTHYRLLAKQLQCRLNKVCKYHLSLNLRSQRFGFCQMEPFYPFSVFWGVFLQFPGGFFGLFFHGLKQVPFYSSVQENAAPLFCCEVPEMYCERPQHLGDYIISFFKNNFWVSLSFKIANNSKHQLLVDLRDL